MKVWSEPTPVYAVVAAMSLMVPMICAHMGMMTPRRERLDILLGKNDITTSQYDVIVKFVGNDEMLDTSMMDHDHHSTEPIMSEEQTLQALQWIELEVTEDRMSRDTEELITNLLDWDLQIYSPTVAKEAMQGNYDGNGVVNFLAWSNFSPPSDGQLYNGIWGYETGNREYALQCNSIGLHILDVTTDDVVKVQTIPMDGGTTWRDVATYSHYAYVASQGGTSSNSNAWVINLEALSSTTVQGEDSNPIFDDHIKDIGYLNWGHTLNVAKGLLFLNGSGPSEGCKILDLVEDPWNPIVLVDETSEFSSQAECHDSYVQTIDGRDILISADGYTKKWRLFDMTDIRDDTNIPFLSSTPIIAFGGVYAHEGVVSDDGQTLFIFNEGPNFDIAAYDISIITSPTLITQFEWSGDLNDSSYVHNGFARGPYLFVAYFQAGLRVFNISNVQNGIIIEVGCYETYRDPDGDGIFNNQITGSTDGAWNVYVGFSSGKVLVSDTNHGTFVVTVSDSPTQAPTACQGDYVTIDLTTDYYAQETSWTVTNNDDGNLEFSSSSLENSQSYQTVECLLPGCYTFEILDSFGDGICCTDGSGSYTVTLDDTVIGSGDQFESSETVTFCVAVAPMCMDSPLNAANGDEPIGCADVADDVNLCNLPGAESHCPYACDACDEYACKDSEIPFLKAGNIISCSSIAAAPPKRRRRLCNQVGVLHTCRETCQLC